jgi:hypothetical protein
MAKVATIRIWIKQVRGYQKSFQSVAEHLNPPPVRQYYLTSKEGEGSYKRLEI